MSWQQAGQESAHTAPERWQRLGEEAARAAPDKWPEVRESIYRQACAERDKNVRGLQVEGALLQAEERQIVADLNASPARPAHVLRLSLGLGRLSGAVGFLLLGSNFVLIYQALAIAGYGGVIGGIVAGILTVPTAYALEYFLRQLAEGLPRTLLRIWHLFLPLLAALSLLGGILALSLIVAQYETVKRATELDKGAAVEVVGTPGAHEPAPDQHMYTTFYQRTGRLSNLFRILLAVGLEFVAALAWHEGRERVSGARSVLRAQRRLEQIRRRMGEHAKEIAQWEQEPEIRREAFTQGAMLEAGRQEQMRKEAEERAAQSPPEAEERQAPVAEPEPGFEWPPGLGLSLAILAFIIFFAIVFAVAVKEAMGAEMLVAAVDLTASSGGEEFQENLRGVEGIISQLPLGSRLIVLAITDHSFSAPALLDARLSEDAGMFGERLKAGHEQLIRIWRERSKALEAKHQATDIFGAIWKTSIFFQEAPGMDHRLVLLSDMRQFGRGFNFEESSGISPGILQRIERAGLIPSLPNVKVWILGAHAQGISEQHWMALRSLWMEYFRKAGAEVVSYSADRRWTHE